MIPTERRTPIPAKMTLAGENACEIDVNEWTSDGFIS